jgi:hypothetical protein
MLPRSGRTARERVVEAHLGAKLDAVGLGRLRHHQGDGVAARVEDPEGDQRDAGDDDEDPHEPAEEQGPHAGPPIARVPPLTPSLLLGPGVEEPEPLVAAGLVLHLLRDAERVVLVEEVDVRRLLLEDPLDLRVVLRRAGSTLDRPWSINPSGPPRACTTCRSTAGLGVMERMRMASASNTE